MLVSFITVCDTASVQINADCSQLTPAGVYAITFKVLFFAEKLPNKEVISNLFKL